MTTLKPGDKVILATPDNRRLDGSEATVDVVTDYGAELVAPKAGSGRFRALFDEMRPAAAVRPPTATKMLQSREQGYSGDICSNCQGSRMRRNGACLLCADCGSTSGCS